MFNMSDQTTNGLNECADLVNSHVNNRDLFHGEISINHTYLYNKLSCVFQNKKKQILFAFKSNNLSRSCK